VGAETFDFGNGRAVWMLSAVFKDMKNWRDRKERETTTLGEKSRRKGILGEGSRGDLMYTYLPRLCRGVGLAAGR
jgi:hypothetical protein